MEPASHSACDVKGDEPLTSSVEKPAAPRTPFLSWGPYAIACGLLLLGIGEMWKIIALQSRLAAEKAEVALLNQSNALVGLRLVTLEARDPAYASAKIIVAWDPYGHRGVISLQELPAPQPGRDYQLWLLDPDAPTPINAGLLRTETGSRSFGVKPVATPYPGFAITLEPDGGSPVPTGSILFAVAPGH